MDKSLSTYYEQVNKYDYQQELDCVNALQRTKWRINTPVLEVMRACWDSGQSWNGLEGRDNLPLPPYTFDKKPAQMNEREKAEFKKWCQERSEVHKHNTESMSKRLAIEATLKLAEEYAQYDEFYFQWQIDFRTRKYPRESFLSPQVADYGKSLLTFATGMEINSPEEASWLAIHGANCYGVDKIPLVEREMWALGNTEHALKVAEDPLNYLWWQEGDEPWAVLAWCFEWAEYTIAVGEGKTFITTLPCQVDGSCNGIQHLSAMNLDEEGGRSVNLLPADKPQDIYQDVADAATVTLQAEAHAGNELAAMLLEVGVCRSIAKKPVMIVPYSGTKSTCRENIKDALFKKCKGNLPWGSERANEAAGLCNNHVWDAINNVITGARDVMNYITQIAVLYGTHNTIMGWVTPTGYNVQLRYFKKKSQRVKAHLDNKVVRLRVDEDTALVDKSKYRTSSSPNLVHSMDACALTMTVNRCVADGVEDFAMIHDSFGTHSPNMDVLNRNLREAFVDLYQNNDILGDLYKNAVLDLPEDVDVPKPPVKGSLELNQVLNSKYFFA